MQIRLHGLYCRNRNVYMVTVTMKKLFNSCSIWGIFAYFVKTSEESVILLGTTSYFVAPPGAFGHLAQGITIFLLHLQ